LALLAVVLVYALITGCGGARAGGQQSNATTDKAQDAEWRWRNGDIVYAYNGHTDHMGMIDANVSAVDNSPDVIDANTLGGVRRHNDFDKWADQGEWKNIEGYHVRAPVHSFDWEQMALEASVSVDGCESQQLESYRGCSEVVSTGRRGSGSDRLNTGAVYNAQNKVDAAYSIFQKNSPTSTHSSQLIWRVYKYVYDIDLDSDGGWWIWPKDIRGHRYVKAIP